MTNKNFGVFISILSLLSGLFIIVSGYSDNGTLLTVREKVLSWAGILFAFLLFFEILKFIITRFRHVGDSPENMINNLVCFAAFTAVVILSLSGKNNKANIEDAVYTIQSAAESTAAGLICIAIICALFRFPQLSRGKMKISFLLGLLIFLVLFSGIQLFVSFSSAIEQAIVLIKAIPLGGIYGLLIGAAIGTLITCIRVIFFGDHPYKERNK